MVGHGRANGGTVVMTGRGFDFGPQTESKNQRFLHLAVRTFRTELLM